MNFDDPAQARSQEVRMRVRSHVSYVQHRRQEDAEGRPQKRPRPRCTRRSINAWAPHDSISGSPTSPKPDEASTSSGNFPSRSEPNHTTQQRLRLHESDQLRRPRPGHTSNIAELPVRSANQRHLGQNQRRREDQSLAPAHILSTGVNATDNLILVGSSWPTRNA